MGRAAAIPRTSCPARRYGDPPLSVLLVDDNRDGADALAMLVEAYGHRVRVAYSAGEARRAVAAGYRAGRPHPGPVPGAGTAGTTWPAACVPRLTGTAATGRGDRAPGWPPGRGPRGSTTISLSRPTCRPSAGPWPTTPGAPPAGPLARRLTTAAPRVTIRTPKSSITCGPALVGLYANPAVGTVNLPIDTSANTPNASPWLSVSTAWNSSVPSVDPMTTLLPEHPGHGELLNAAGRVERPGPVVRPGVPGEQPAAAEPERRHRADQAGHPDVAVQHVPLDLEGGEATACRAGRRPRTR